jgi:hypothetical protein
MDSRKVFISYSHKDKPKVSTLLKALGDKKIEYWSDQELRPGEDWVHAIESALRTASIFLFFISPDFLASNSAMFEIGFALSRARESGAVIVPVLLRQTQLPEYIRRFQYIDAASLEPSEFADKVQRIVESRAA